MDKKRFYKKCWFWALIACFLIFILSKIIQLEVIKVSNIFTCFVYLLCFFSVFGLVYGIRKVKSNIENLSLDKMSLGNKTVLKWSFGIISCTVILIWSLYMLGLNFDFITTPFEAGDLLGFFGDFLSFLGTVALGALALWQNHVFNISNEDSQTKLEKLNNAAVEINNRMLKIKELEYMSGLDIRKNNGDFKGNNLEINLSPKKEFYKLEISKGMKFSELPYYENYELCEFKECSYSNINDTELTQTLKFNFEKIPEKHLLLAFSIKIIYYDNEEVNQEFNLFFDILKSTHYNPKSYIFKENKFRYIKEETKK